MRSSKPQDAIAGGAMIAIAAAFLFFGRNLPIGTLRHMGAGFLPTIVAACLMVLGGALVALSFAAKPDSTDFPFLRPTVFIAVAPLIFAAAIDQLGFFIAVALTALVARLGVRHPYGWDLMLMPAGLAAFCVVLFVHLLGQPLEIWP